MCAYLEVGGQVLGTVGTEIPREQVASTHAVTLSATHGACGVTGRDDGEMRRDE